MDAAQADDRAEGLEEPQARVEVGRFFRTMNCVEVQQCVAHGDVDWWQLPEVPRKNDADAAERLVCAWQACLVAPFLETDANRIGFHLIFIEFQAKMSVTDLCRNRKICHKCFGTIHWISANQGQKAEVHLYDRLFNDPFPLTNLL